MNVVKSVVFSSLILVTLTGCDILFGSGGDGALIYGEAYVDEISVLILESFPVQIQILANGNLPDSCTQIDEIEKSRVGNNFNVTITTSRPADLSCAQVLVPFEERFPLDVYGLPAGTYTVDVNGVTDRFELSVDNAPPGQL